MAVRSWIRIFAGSFAILSIVLPWYMRSDPGQTINLISFLFEWSQISPIQIAIAVFMAGAILSLFSDNGISLLALGFVSTVLVMEDYRMYYLGQNLPWGLGFYFATAAIFICLLDVLIASRQRFKDAKRAAASDHIGQQH